MTTPQKIYFELPPFENIKTYLSIYDKNDFIKSTSSKWSLQKLFNTVLFSYLNNKEKPSLLESTSINYRDSIIICHETTNKKQDYIFRNYFALKLYSFIKPYLLTLKIQNKHSYEVILGENPQKPYFDIDMPMNTVDDLKDIIVFNNQITNGIILASENKIKPTDIMMFNSHSSNSHLKKLSWHYIIANYYFLNNKENYNFYLKVLEHVDVKFHKYIDPLYSSIQQLRIYKSKKFGTNRVKELDQLSLWKPSIDLLDINLSYEDRIDTINQIDNEILFNSLVTVVSGCTYLNLPQPPESYFKQYNRINIDDEYAEKAINLFYQLYDPNREFFILSSIKNNFINLSRLKSYNCHCCNKKEDHDNIDALIILYDNGDVFRHCYRRKHFCLYMGNIGIYKESEQKIDEEEDDDEMNDKEEEIKTTTKYSDKYYTTKDDTVQTTFYNTRYCKPFTTEYKINFLKSFCGTGKTVQTLKFIQDGLDRGESCLILCFRRSYSTSFLEIINALLTNPVFKKYLDIESIKIIYPHIFNSVESIHRLDRSFNMLIFDEFISLLDQLFSPFHGNNIKDNRETLEELIKESKYIIACDNDMDGRGVKYIKHVLPNEIIDIKVNSFLPNQENIYANKHLYEMFELIKKYLELNKRIQIVSSNKNFGLIIYYYIMSLNIITKDDIIYHHSDGDDYKEILENVNVGWLKYKVLIYTSIIGSGIDFNMKHFHALFSFGDFKCTDVRNLFQAENRVRYLEDRIIYFCHHSYECNYSLDKNVLLNQLNEEISLSKNFDKSVFSKRDLNRKSYFDKETSLKRYYKTLDPNDIYVQLYLDFLVEKNISRNSFNYTYIQKIISNGNKYIKKQSRDENKFIATSEWIKNAYDKIKLEKIETIKDMENFRTNETFDELIERISVRNMTKSDKIFIKISTFRKLLKEDIVLDNIKDSELINYNIDNYDKIYYYKCLSELNDIDWIVQDIEFNNNNYINKNFKAYGMYIIKYIVFILGFSSVKDFTTRIDQDKIYETKEFFTTNFYKIKKVFNLDIKDAPDEYVAILKYINSILRKSGLHLKSIKVQVNKIFFKVLSLRIKDPKFEKSLLLYIPLEGVFIRNVDSIYESNFI